jgi:hypothetical protein
MSEGPSTKGCGVFFRGSSILHLKQAVRGDKNRSDVRFHGDKADVTHSVQVIKGLRWFEVCRGGRRFQS